jgi:hypothetical protein
MAARTSGLNRAIRARAKQWLGWDTGQGSAPSSGVRRLISDAVMHNSMDMALRYRPIVRYLRKHFEAGALMIDVGSGSAGITPYLHRRVVGVDRNFDGPPSSWLVKCVGDVLTLPFADRSVDVTLCVDTLEHIPPGERPAAIKELLRITRRLAVIAVPCGPLSAQRDRDLSRTLNARLARHDRFVDEHVQNGLPELDELRTWIADAGDEMGRTFAVRNEGNVHLGVWWMVQMAKVSLVWRAALIVAFPLAFPILSRFNGPPCYRQILFVEA